MPGRENQDIGGRLVEELSDAPGELTLSRTRAIELIRSMDRFYVPPGRKQRLLLVLGQGWVPPNRMWLRTVMVGALLIGGGTVASAALTNWPMRLVHALRDSTSVSTSGRTVWQAPMLATATARVGPAQSMRQGSSPAVAPVRRVPVGVRPRRRIALAPSPDDPSLVVAATRALRVDDDPKSARALATSYLEQNPNGTLADEALAISIEAAIARHDPDAVALSVRYLTQFPRGAFCGLAERALIPLEGR